MKEKFARLLRFFDWRFVLALIALLLSATAVQTYQWQNETIVRAVRVADQKDSEIVHLRGEVDDLRTQLGDLIEAQKKDSDEPIAARASADEQRKAILRLLERLGVTDTP